MASFTPPLGSSSPEVLEDNASRLDKLLNSPESTVPDRSGEALKSWAGIEEDSAEKLAEIDAIITSLDTGKFTFPDIATGMSGTTNGQYFRVILGSGNELAFIYYRNLNGVAVEITSMYSKAFIDAFKARVEALIRTGDLDGLIFAVTDPAGFIGFQVEKNGGFGTKDVYVSPGSLRAGDLVLNYSSDALLSAADANGFFSTIINNALQIFSTRLMLPGGTYIESTDEAIIRTVDKNGFYVDVVGNDGKTPGAGSGNGESAEALYLKAQNVINLAYVDKIYRRTLTRLKFPTDAYNHFLMECQSLGMGYQAWPAVTKTPKYDTLMFGNSVRPAGATANAFNPLGGAAWQPLKAVVQSIGGGTIQTDADIQAFVRGANNEGESPVVASVNGFRRHFLEQHSLSADPSRLFVASVVGVSGQSIENLIDDTLYYNRVVECVTKAKALADSQGKTYSVTAVDFMQGEQNYTNATPKAVYKAGQGQLRTKVNTTIKGITGQKDDPAWFFYQTGFTYSPNPVEQPLNAVELWVGMAQWEFCQETPNCFMVGPNYQLPDKGGHLMTNGSRWMGCYFAKAKDVVFNKRRPFHPVAPIAYKVIDNSIYVSFYVDQPPLQFISPFRRGTRVAIANKGFRAFTNVQNDSAGIGTELTVTAVDIVSDTVVRLTCATAPQGTVRVVYATRATPTSDGQGMLADSDSYIPDEIYEYDPQFTQWTEENIPELIGKPYPMQNWCIAFSQTFQAS